MKKVQLERILQSLAPVPQPKPEREPYATPATIAAEVVYGAYGRGDIEGCAVLDLGCGNGGLGIGAKLLGAARVVGVDSDPAAIRVAEQNAATVRVEAEWRLDDVADVREAFDTVLMNPPFGAQIRHGPAEAFVRQYLETAGATITDRFPYSFPIPHTFEFHRDEARRIDVVLFRVEVAKG
ncbi:MAG: methyltransferase [Methanobacteriota archaeon]|nr:MAG: methyltransferase [Euryarchaeota archaeon]